MIYDGDFFYSIRSIPEAIIFLENSLSMLQHIAAVVIQGKFMGTINPIRLKFGQHLFIQKMGKDTYVEQYLVIWNNHCNIRITEDTISKIYQSID